MSSCQVNYAPWKSRLVHFREAAFQGFGYLVAAAHMFLKERLLALPQVRLYSGLVDGEARWSRRQ